jgi:uncharacterized phiE125 gp8 family phage protein
MLKIALVQDSAIEPVSVDEVKAHLRVTDNEEDSLIAGLITSARYLVENTVRKSLITKTWRLYLDDFPRGAIIDLPYPPLLSVTSVKYYDQDGAFLTLDTGVYQTDNRSTPGRIVLTESGAWPSTEQDKVNAVEVEYIAGYGAEAATVPSPIRLAITHLACHWFENREPYKMGALSTVPHTLEILLMPYRYFSLR